MTTTTEKMSPLDASLSRWASAHSRFFFFLLWHHHSLDTDQTPPPPELARPAFDDALAPKRELKPRKSADGAVRRCCRFLLVSWVLLARSQAGHAHAPTTRTTSTSSTSSLSLPLPLNKKTKDNLLPRGLARPALRPRQALRRRAEEETAEEERSRRRRSRRRRRRARKQKQKQKRRRRRRGRRRPLLPCHARPLLLLRRPSQAQARRAHAERPGLWRHLQGARRGRGRRGGGGGRAAATGEERRGGGGAGRGGQEEVDGAACPARRRRRRKLFRVCCFPRAGDARAVPAAAEVNLRAGEEEDEQ